jgi:hypothetical protein
MIFLIREKTSLEKKKKKMFGKKFEKKSIWAMFADSAEFVLYSTKHKHKVRVYAVALSGDLLKIPFFGLMKYHRKTDFIYSRGKGGMVLKNSPSVHLQTPAIALGQICIPLLVNKEWDANDRHSIIGGFHQGVETTMGDEKAHFGMG